MKITMTNQLENAKKKLGEQTENLENKMVDFWDYYSPNYTNFESWQRGLILIGIFVLLALALYYLTRENQDRKAQRKAQAEAAFEEKIIKRMELLKKLRE